MKNKTENKNELINKIAVKFIKIITICLPFTSFILINTNIDNDMYFMLPTGKYILENGFPHKDFLTIHSSMDIIVQQWLADVAFYKTYSVFGEVGLIAIVFIAAVLLIFLFYYLIHIITGKHLLSLFGTTIIAFWLFPSYLVTRPQIFTFIIIAAELICLEKYVKTGTSKHLVPIVILSLALINLHASMWMMLFAFMFPYFVQSLNIKIGKFKLESKCRFLPLAACAILSIAAGFVNPYGIDAMLYIFSSYGYDSINSFINEMIPVQITDTLGAEFFALIAIIILIYIVYRKGIFETRFVLLTVGTVFFGLTSYKAFSFFIIAAVPSVCNYIKNVNYSIPVERIKDKKTSVKSSVIRITGLIIVLFALCTAVILSTSDSANNTLDNSTNNDKNYVSVRYAPIADELDKLPKEKITLYTGFDAGPYFEFRGYKPYIDARAELFFKKNNNEFDYFNEFYELYLGKSDPKEFVDKYDFTHLVVSKSEYCLKNYLDSSENYTLIEKTETYYLYQSNDFKA